MLVLFPSYPGRPREPDPAFEVEVQCAKGAGFEIGFVDLELQFGGEVVLRNIPEGEHTIVYRGWLTKVEDYQRLDQAVQEKGCRLLEGFEAYREAYEFPRWYDKLKAWTPRSIIIDGTKFNLDDVAEKVEQAFRSGLSDAQLERLAEFNASFTAPDGSPIFHTGHCPIDLLELPGPRPVLVKDFVKSRKQDWHEACFIPDARDREHVKKVVARFLELGEPLVGGLVFRQFEHFKKIGTHPKSHMPVINEWRAFMINGKLAYLAPYWSAGDYKASIQPAVSRFEAVVRESGLISPFIGLDMAEDVSGEWRVIEINPGGATGVPEGGDAGEFYKVLRQWSPT